MSLAPPLRVLWICTLPRAVEQEVFGREVGSQGTALSWIMGHLPPPAGIDLHLACFTIGGRAEITSVERDGATFHFVPFPARGRAMTLFLRDTARYAPLVKRLQADVIHGWGTEDSHALVAVNLAPHRHVVGIQGLITEYRKRLAMPRRTMITQWTERAVLKRARVVVAESLASATMSQPYCPRTVIEVIEHPLRAEILAGAPATGEEPVMVYVGGCNEGKGLWDAVNAFAAGAPPEWKLRIVGGGSEETIVALKNWIAEKGFAGRVIYEGSLPVERLVEVMASASVFTLPTRIDTGPTALKEALAMGLWPICYDNSGPGDYIRRYAFGSLARDLDLADLTAVYRRDLTARPWLDPARRDALRSVTQHDFAPETAWAKLEALYHSVAASPR